MHKVLARLKFLLRATNQHGVHSPFVYQFLTKGLYVQKRYAKNNTLNLVIKSTLYFEFKNLALNDIPKAKETLLKYVALETHAEEPLDLLLLSGLKKTPEAVLEGHHFHNDSLIIIAHIHKSKEAEKQWEAFVKHPSFTVTIDGFHFGLAFIREEQVKEHFRLRI